MQVLAGEIDAKIKQIYKLRASIAYKMENDPRNITDQLYARNKLKRELTNEIDKLIEMQLYLNKHIEQMKEDPSCQM
jgi:hypothetical protein